MDSAVKITAKLQELEKQDNIVRLSHNGNLIFNLQDGELRLRRPPEKQLRVENLGAQMVRVNKLQWDKLADLRPLRGHLRAEEFVEAPL